MPTFEQNNLQAFLNRLNSNSLTAGDQAILVQALNFCIANWGNTGISVDPNTGAGTDPAPVDDEWFAVLYNEALGLGGGSGLVPTSWTQPTWFIDPVNGLDTNTGFTSSTAIKTWARLVALWGTNSPVLAQNTTITFLSSHVDNTDPVTFRPYIAKGALVSIQGTAPTVIQAGVVLAATTAKNRAAGANSLLITTLGAGGSVGQLIANTTAGKASRAWAYKSLGGNSFSLTQPLAPMVVGTPTAPAEVDTWANGDTVNLLQPVNVNIAQFEPFYIDFNGALTNAATIYQLTIFDPQGVGKDSCQLGESVNVFECLCQRILVLNATSDHPVLVSNQINFLNGGGALYYGPTIIVGGAWLTTMPFQGLLVGGAANSVFDGDFILGKAATVQSAAGFSLAFVFLDAPLTIEGTLALIQIGFYANGIVYGSAGNNINLQGNVRLANNTGHTFAATFTAPALVVGINMNGAGTANSVILGAPDTLNGNITTTPAHFDAAAGAAGFGGLAFNLGGASVASAA